MVVYIVVCITAVKRDPSAQHSATALHTADRYYDIGMTRHLHDFIDRCFNILQDRLIGQLYQQLGLDTADREIHHRINAHSTH